MEEQYIEDLYQNDRSFFYVILLMDNQFGDTRGPVYGSLPNSKTITSYRERNIEINTHKNLYVESNVDFNKRLNAIIELEDEHRELLKQLIKKYENDVPKEFIEFISKYVRVNEDAESADCKIYGSTQTNYEYLHSTYPKIKDCEFFNDLFNEANLLIKDFQDKRDEINHDPNSLNSYILATEYFNGSSYMKVKYFIERYVSNNLEQPTGGLFTKLKPLYLKNEDIRFLLDKGNIDVDKFWILIQFIYDFCIDSYIKNQFRYKIVRNINNFKGLDKKEKIILTLKKNINSRKNTIIELEDSIENLSYFFDLEKLSEFIMFDSDCKKDISKTYKKSNTILCYFIAYYFKKFFEIANSEFIRKYSKLRILTTNAQNNLIAEIFRLLEINDNYDSKSIKMLLNKNFHQEIQPKGDYHSKWYF